MSTRHPSEEELILHYYGEGEGAAALDAHLEACAECRSNSEAMARALEAVTDATVNGRAVPEFGVHETARAWQRLAPRLAFLRARSKWRPARVMVPLALAASLILAFALGRRWPLVPVPSPAAASRGPERVLLVAVGDHLERSEMLLVELVNATPGATLDIASEQEQAQELVGASRLYRQAVSHAGEPGLASVLEELERLLVEISHRPSSLTPDELAQLRQRIESRGLLFKVRVLESEVREKEKETAPLAGAVS